MTGAVHPAPVPARDPLFKRLVPEVLQVADAEYELVARQRSRTKLDLVGDTLAMLVTLGVGVLLHFQVAAKTDVGTDWILTADLPLLVLVSGLMFWRRRWPFVVTVVVAMCSVIAYSTGLGALIMAFAIGAHRRPAVAVVGLGVLAVATVGATWLWRNAAGADFWSDALIGVAIGVAVGVWGMFTGARRQLMLSLRDRAQRAESEQQLRIEQARQGERNRIAREMHDVLAHRMSLLSVHAGALEFRTDASPQEVSAAAGVIRATAHEALEELRQVIGVLRVSDAVPSEDASANGGAAAAAPTAGIAADGSDARPEPPQPDLSAVPHLVEEWRQAGARIDLDLDLDHLAQVPTTVGRTAYRIVQEGLTNATKHAPGTLIHVSVIGTDRFGLDVEITNPSSVDAPQAAIPGTGIGLIGLRERTELAGGTLESGFDEPSRTFTLKAHLPCGGKR